MRATWRWMLAVAAVLALGAVVLAVDEATRDDDGDTAYQGLTTGEGNPIQVTADAYGRLWVNIASGTAGVQTEDAAHTSADKGVMTLAVTKATRAALAADGDYTPLQLTTNGDLRTRDDDLNTATGTATTAAVDGDAAGSAVAHLRGINKKLAAGVGVTDTNGAAMAADLNELTAAPVAKTPTHVAAVIVGTPGTPVALAADATYFTVATLQAGRAAAANASLITIGGNTAYTSQRAIEMAPGDTRELRPPAGTKWDLNDWYIDGVNTDDGVRIEIVAP